MDEKMIAYLNNQVLSNKMKEVVLNLIIKKKSLVCLTLNHIIQNLECDFLPSHKKYKAVESLRMLDVRKDNDSHVISYLALGKEPEFTEKNKWARKNRQQGKIGKIIKNFIDPYEKLIGIKLSPSDIEEFVNDAKSYLSDDNYEFKLVSGEDIRKYYDGDNYAPFSRNNTLHNSCMRYSKCQKYFDIYVTNPDCEMLLMFDRTSSLEKIVGRALVWNYKGRKYVDRRYYILDMYHTAMKDYIKKQGWCYKEHNTYDDDFNLDFMVPGENGEYYSDEVSLSFEYNNDFHYYPYADTLKYWDGRKLSNNKKLVDYNPKVLRCTGGEYDRDDDDDDYIECECCGTDCRPDDICYTRDGNICTDCIAYDYRGARISEDNAQIVSTLMGDIIVHVDDLSTSCTRISDNYYILPSYHEQSRIVTDFTEEEKEEYLLKGYLKASEGMLYLPA